MLWCGCPGEAPKKKRRKSLTREWVRFGCGLRGTWWRGGDGSWRRDRGRGGMWSLSLTGLKTGHYLPNEFGARGRQRSVRGWGRLLGWGWLCGRAGCGVWVCGWAGDEVGDGAAEWGKAGSSLRSE